MGSDHLRGAEVLDRPAVAVIGFDASIAAALAQLCRNVAAFADVGEYATSGFEGDIAVVSGSVELDDDRLHVLICGDAVHDGRQGVGRVSSLSQSKATQLVAADDVPEAFRAAVNGLREGTKGDATWVSALSFGDGAVARPLVIANDLVVAALYDRGEGIGLAVPGDADVVEWFRGFLEHVHNLDAAVVPLSPPKVARPDEWRTASELEVLAQLERIDQEIAELTKWRGEAAASLIEAGRDAEVGERWMLWAEGDDLVGSVRMSLEELGFTVVEVDRPGREQLQVRHEELPDWVALVEVAAYDCQPGPADLRAVNHHRMAYIAEHGHQPTQVWWVANEYRALDPSRRPRALESLADSAALVDVVAMSTRDLFLLGRDVGLQRMGADAARKLLTEAETGVFRFVAEPD
jgi:hypothetical protein